MREGWEYKKLGDCSDIFDSQRKPVTKKDRKSGIYPYYGATGIQDYVDDYIFNGRYVLIGEDGAKWAAYDNSAYIIEGKSWVNNHAHVLKTHDILNDSFLTYFLNYSNLESYISGAVVRKLTQASLVKIEIPIPPKSTQLAIVSELDKLNELLRLKKEQLKEYDNLAQSIFYDMFGDPVKNEKGWEVKKLGGITSKISDGVHAKPKYTENGKPFISVVNITSGYLNFKDCKFVSEETCSLINKRCKPEKGDILYTKVGATYGIPALVDTDLDFCLYVSVSLIKPFKKIVDSVFLKFMMSLPYIKFQADKSIKGIGVPDLHLNQIKNFDVILPPLPLQQQFANKIEAIEHQKDLLKKSIKETETLLQSRMDYWFNV